MGAYELSITRKYLRPTEDVLSNRHRTPTPTPTQQLVNSEKNNRHFINGTFVPYTWRSTVQLNLVSVLYSFVTLF